MSSGIDIVKFPSKFVTAPKLLESFTCIVTPGSGIPNSSLTVPVIVFDWEKTKRE